MQKVNKAVEPINYPEKWVGAKLLTFMLEEKDKQTQYFVKGQSQSYEKIVQLKMLYAYM